MGRLLIGLAALFIAVAPTLRARQEAPEVDWPAVFAALARLEELAAGEDRELAVELLRITAEEQGNSARGRILSAQLARVLGTQHAALELEPAEIVALEPSECWLASQVLGEGSARDESLVRALEGLPAAESSKAWTPGYERFVALDAEYRTEGARRMASALHHSAQAGWSAANLAMVLRRLGRTEEAVLVLGEQLTRAADVDEEVALLQDRALAWLGGGYESRARADLGASIARGSPDAGVVLGRMALAAGDPARARVALRRLLRSEPPRAWALRGWGLSLLPGADRGF